MTDEIRFLFENSRGAIRGLIVYFNFRSKIKNDFTVGPHVTNEEGYIVLSKQSVKNIITLSKTDFPMDYSGELKDCDLMTVLVETKSELENRITRLKEFYPGNAYDLQTMLDNASNDTVGLYKEFEMPILEKEIHLHVE